MSGKLCIFITLKKEKWKLTQTFDSDIYTISRLRRSFGIAMHLWIYLEFTQHFSLNRSPLRLSPTFWYHPRFCFQLTNVLLQSSQMTTHPNIDTHLISLYICATQVHIWCLSLWSILWCIQEVSWKINGLENKSIILHLIFFFLTKACLLKSS